jgi:peptidoglycan/LPS O-acetylase OafA/YrhL
MRRIGALDGLRGVAILLVLARHAAAYVAPEFGWFVPGGFVGVDLFFVLSGFLITSLIIERFNRNGERHPRAFYIRRALRLAPAVVCLGVVVIAFTAVVEPGTVGQTAGNILATFAYVTNYLHHAYVSPYVGHMWSLAVEEQFYLVWPLVLLALLRRGTDHRRILRGLVMTIGAIVAWRASVWVRTPVNPGLYYHTDTRADALLIGSMLGLGYPFAKDWCARHRDRLMAAGGALVAAAALSVPSSDRVLYLGGFTVVALASAAIIAAILVGAGAHAFNAPWLRRLGVLSYSLYLWHFPVFVSVDRHMTDAPLALRLLIGFGVTGIAAAGSYLGVERVFLRMKDRMSERETVARAEPADATPALVPAAA